MNDAATTATLVPPYAIDRNSKLDLRTEPDACKLSVTAKTKDHDLLAMVTLDPKTNTVKGTLRISGSPDPAVTLEGVRDVGQPVAKDACIKPGIFKLVVPAEQAWTSDDGKGCEHALLEVRFLVEPFGDRLSIDQIDADGNAEWAAEDVYQDNPCEAEVRFRHDQWYTYSKFTFAGDAITATVTHASMQITATHDSWRCEIANPMAWVERVVTQ